MLATYKWANSVGLKSVDGNYKGKTCKIIVKPERYGGPMNYWIKFFDGKQVVVPWRSIK